MGAGCGSFRRSTPLSTAGHRDAFGLKGTGSPQRRESYSQAPAARIDDQIFQTTGVSGRGVPSSPIAFAAVLCGLPDDRRRRTDVEAVYTFGWRNAIVARAGIRF